MSAFPQRGDGIAVFLPPGKTVFWDALVQSDRQQHVQLADSAGTVVFHAAGSSLAGHSPTSIGASSFVTADTRYTLSLWHVEPNGSMRFSTVLRNEQVVNQGATVHYATSTFLAENGDDGDFNDLCVTLSWSRTTG